jgi:hypothetical protein
MCYLVWLYIAVGGGVLTTLCGIASGAEHWTMAIYLAWGFGLATVASAFIGLVRFAKWIWTLPRLSEDLKRISSEYNRNMPVLRDSSCLVGKRNM